jgi:hypothetical protein
MYVKIHRSYRRIVAVCDSEILGKKFEERKMQLDVRENFYKGEKFNAERVLEIMKSERADDSTFNIAGKRAVELALKNGIISEGNVGKVDGVPFALVLL